MGSRSQSNVFNNLRAERLTVDYLHLNQAPIRLNGYPFGTADLPNTANFLSKDSLQQADWLTANPSSLSFIKNKPLLSAVALSGDYADLTGTPSAVPVNPDWSEQDPTKLDFIRNKPMISAVGSTGRYSDLVQGSGQPIVPTSVDYNATSSTATTLAVVNRPVLPPAPVNADWAVSSANNLAFIRNKPSLSAVALSGSFGDLLNRPVVYQSVDWNASTNSGTTLAIANKPAIPASQVNADWAAATGPAAILNKPLVPPAQVQADWAATSGVAAIQNKPVVPAAQVNSDWLASSGSVAYIANKPILGRVALTNSYTDLNNLPTITPQQQSDWAATSGVTAIQNKPSYAAVAYTGKFSDLASNSGQPTVPTAADWSLASSTSTTLAIRNRPVIPAPQVQSDWSQSDNTQISFIQGKPTLAAVATSGSYNDLSNKPTVSNTVQADWTQADSTQGNYISHKPILAPVATSGKYSDLAINSGQPANVTAADWSITTASGGVIPITSKPVIPASQVNSDWNSTSGVSQILNLPTFGAVAYSNNYADLTGKPQVTNPVNADWNSAGGLSQILNRPNLGLVATSNRYADLTGLPIIPTTVDYNAVSSSGATLAIANKPIALSAFRNDVGFYKAYDSPQFATVTAASIASSGIVSLNSSMALQLAADLSSSTAAMAGTMAYNPPGGACTPANSSSGSVDIFGAGTASGSRSLNLWDLVSVQGTLMVTGGTSLQAMTATSTSTAGAASCGSLSVSGSSTLQGVNVTTLSASGAVSTGALTASSMSTGGNLTVTGTAAIAGATSTHALTATSISTSGTLGVTGASTFAGLSATSISDSGTLSVTGNSTLGGTLGVTGASTFAGLSATSISDSGTLSVTGNSTLGGTLGVTGASTFAGLSATSISDSGTLSVTGNSTLGGTLGVTGASTFAGLSATSISDSGALSVTGASTFAGLTATSISDSGALSVTGNSTLGGTLGVTGASTFAGLSATSISDSGTLSVTGNSTLGGTLGVTGASTFAGLSATSISDSGTLSVTGASTFAGLSATSISDSGTLSVTGNSTLGGTLGVTGASTLAGVTATSINNTGNETISGTISVAGIATTSGGINVPGANTINLGSDVTKAVAAGRIGYQTYTVGALDVVGAGTSTRLIKLWDNVIIPGTLASAAATFTGTGTPFSGVLIANTGSGNSAFASGAAIDFRGYAAANSVSARIRSGDATNGGYGGNLCFYTKAVNNADTDSLTLRMSLDEVGSLALNGTATFNGVFLPGQNIVNFGSNLSKQQDAGKIGYQLFSGGLDILGAGTSLRTIKLWDDVIVNNNLTVSATTTCSTGINIPGANVINFGSDQSKAGAAGNIGYQTYDSGCLNIVGAGTGTRTVKMYDNFIVTGNISTSSLTVNGTAVTGGGGTSGTPNWITLSLVNGWVASSTAKYYVDRVTGRVHLSGNVSGGSNGTVMFYVGSTYAVTNPLFFICGDSSGAATGNSAVRLSAGGTCPVYGSTGGTIALCSISWIPGQ